MIKDIEINNFRCFNRLKVSGCKRINLISGKNNVGKTALLEAIFLNSTPNKDTIFSLGDLRKQSSSFRKVLPQRMWSNFFFQQDLTSTCSIAAGLRDRHKVVTISIDNNYEQLLANDTIVRKYFDDLYEDKITEEHSGNNDTNPSILLLEVKIDDREVYQTRIISVSYQISQGKDVDRIDSIRQSSFIPSSSKSSIDLTKEFDRARLNEREDEVLKAFQVIDRSIERVESFTIPEPTIYLTRQHEKRLPLFLFGDAMNRIADIVLKIINNRDSIVLIDEIENGIHHSSQIAFWDLLHRLADRLNVQIFATTHSLEMTEAFIKVGLDRQESAAHFELTRHEKNNRIVAINRDLETLEYAIDRNKEVRGGS